MTPVELTTTSRVAAELGVECSTDLQKTLLPIIRSVSATVEKFCGRKMSYKAAAVETRTGVGGPRLRLRRTPVRSLTALQYVDLDGDVVSDLTLDGLQIEDIDDETGHGTSGLVYRAGGFPSSAVYLPYITRPMKVGSERPNYRVTFAGGWVTPSQEADDESVDLPRDLPYDIEEAVVLEVVSRYRRRGADRDIKTERLLSGSVTYESASARRYGMNDMSLEMLRQYRIPADGVI